MRAIDIDQKWTFRRGFHDSLGALNENPGEVVDLPHDGMIGTKVSPDAPARSDSGYFTGEISNYTKELMIPAEWEGECVGLKIDGAMMHATVEVNGSLAAQQHYGYAPFYVDLTGLVTFGARNRITIHVNTSMQPNSRWYTGSGLYRGVRLLHGPAVHVVPDGIFVTTKEISEDRAFLEALVEVDNTSSDQRLAEVTLKLLRDGGVAAEVQSVIHIEAGTVQTARMAFSLKDPLLWSAEEPNLYDVHVTVRDLGIYRTHFIPGEQTAADEAESLFGVRTITADAERGLRINGKTVKLRGGCIHHDNGLLGSVSLYAAEERKIRKLKETGFNAVRTAHNPPSAALIEACDRLGMYVFDEAFDAWEIAKRGGDYSQCFADHWEEDLTAFVRRDRIHPSVILWSTGNEIPERGGLAHGYTKAKMLAETIRRLDGTRPISNGICSLWAGMDDELARERDQSQNAPEKAGELQWEKVTEPFTNGLDIVGYNYMEDLYERDHELFPERVILGSENFPKEIGFRWPMVERLPYVIGDFTWTAWDYIGEAGIGKAVYLSADDPLLAKGPWYLMPQTSSPYPWRTANDADYDITGNLLPQGAYRSVVWGDTRTWLFSYPSDAHGKEEMMSPWGFPAVRPVWNHASCEGKPVDVIVFSGAEEVELLLNGTSLGRKPVDTERPLPKSVRFTVTYEPGTLEAVSYTKGKEVSRTALVTAGEPAALRLTPERSELTADGHDLLYLAIDIVDDQGRVVPDAALPLTAEVKGAAAAAGFGTANPVTEEDYTDAETVSYRGRALLILRAGTEPGEGSVTIRAEGLKDAQIPIRVSAGDFYETLRLPASTSR